MNSTISQCNQKIYWSVPVTGRINISQFIPIIELGRLLDAGKHVTIFIGDLHSQLLNDKSSTLKAKCDFYKDILPLMVGKVTKNINNLSIKLGSEVESSSDYMLDFYLIAGSTPIEKAAEATTNVLIPTKHPLLGGLVYPIVRTVDEKYVEATGQLVCETEKKIVEFTDQVGAKINHQPCERTLFSTLQGLSAKKVSILNEEDDYVDILDNPKQVKKKLGRAFCEPGNVQDNGVLPILEKIIFPIYKLFDISRPEQYGGDVRYSSFEEVLSDFAEQKLHPGDLKKGVESKLNALLDEIVRFYETSKELQATVAIAFPVKKDKKPQQIIGRRAHGGLENLTLDSIDEISSGEKVNLITKRLQEVLQQDMLESILKTRNLRIYWGTATTGRPHVAYFVPMVKIADFLRAKCEVTILLADLHGYLDSQKAPWELLDLRTKYYQRVIVSMLKSINVPIDNLKFVRGTEFELSADFSQDLLKLISQTTLHDAKKAGAEVVKQTSDPLIGSLLYPLLQALDEEYLGCDAQFGGQDQRKIFTYSEKYLPQIGYKKRIHLMNPMIPGLTGGKMSSSELDSKIDLLDDSETVVKKLNAASSPDGILSFVEHVIWPLFGKMTIANTSPMNQSESTIYDSHAELVSSLGSGSLGLEDLKLATAGYINKLLDPIRGDFESEELQALTRGAYP